MYNFQFNNLGSISKGNIELGKITILCGENNTGKTYASYGIYGLLKRLGRLKGHYELNAKELLEKKTTTIDLRKTVNLFNDSLAVLSETFSEQLYELFGTNKEFFKGSKIRVTTDIENEPLGKNILEEAIKFNISFNDETLICAVNKKAGEYEVHVSLVNFEDNEQEKVKFFVRLVKQFIKDRLDKALFKTLPTKPFILPAERAGLNLFHNELNKNRNEIVRELSVSLLNDEEDFSEIRKSVSSYALPISDYIAFLNDKDTLKKEESEFSTIGVEMQKKILKGTYYVDDQSIYFRPANSFQENAKNINLHVSSSTVKTMFGMDFYLNHIAQRGQFLIIDEPELNLHPDNQRKIARILAKMANKGINVVISTHSDYIIKELNNLIMLSNEFKSKLDVMNRYGYEESEILNPNDVLAYMFKDNEIQQMEISEEGIVAVTFDEVINAYNMAADDIFYTLEEEKELQGENEVE
ncbi:AAA family ATPase [Bacillus cereus]|uniref:AAA family ATPase n=1 Tax=Bacillus cereus TaxID=1396 RepID=UPI00148300D4|nr:AAA family ATPase [Bacillus cereus]